jgi:hypothetical protein
MKNRISIIFLFLIAGPAFADRLPEKYYQAEWCEAAGGVQEYTLPDRTRCDCLTENHAVEMDFGRKWAEAIGQALYYSASTGRRAGIVLILESPEDIRYWRRLTTTIEHYKLPIDIWQAGAGAARLPVDSRQDSLR